jgi:ribulose-phosphate 3-epimerase
MVEIHPAILAHDEEEFLRKVDQVRAFGQTLHIDVMDGTFVGNATWAPVDRMRTLLDGIPFEAHLMVADPEHAAPTWLAAGAVRVMFHAEATSRDAMICRATADQCVDLAVALNPETPISRVTPDFKHFRQFLVMGVNPGWSGQPFQDIAIEKVAMLKKLKPDCIVAVDGGVKPENARRLVEAGADILIAGSAITDQDDPAAALLEFKRAINGDGEPDRE